MISFLYNLRFLFPETPLTSVTALVSYAYLGDLTGTRYPMTSLTLIVRNCLNQTMKWKTMMVYINI